MYHLLGCKNSYGLVGFDFSHTGYWSKGITDVGYKTSMIECSNTCIENCVAFNYELATIICYNYLELSNVVEDNVVLDSEYSSQAFIKCQGSY